MLLLLSALLALLAAHGQTLPAAPTSYVSLEAVADFTRKLAAASHGAVQAPRAFGATVENRPLHVVEAGAAHDSTVPALLLTAMHHGREPVGMMANLELFRRLTARYLDGDAEVAALLRFRRFLLVPSVNPDAYEWNIAHRSQRMARKNRRHTCANGGYADAGVDLNRNYPFEWDRDNVGSSPQPCRDDYRGPSPFSEPESAAMRDLVLSEGGTNITVALNWHSFGRLVNLPFAVQSRPEPPAHIYGPLLALARTMAGAMGWSYAHPWEGGLYSCNGEASDWMVDARGILAYSPEVGPAYDDSMTDGQFEQAMWPGPDTLPGLVDEVLKGAWLAAWAAGTNLQVEAGAVVAVAGSDAAAQPCAAPGLPAGSSCGSLQVKGLTLTNAGARLPTGSVVVSAVPASSMSAGPVCVPSSSTATAQAVCVESLHTALQAAKAAGKGQPFCTVNEVDPVLASGGSGTTGSSRRRLSTTTVSGGAPAAALSSASHWAPLSVSLPPPEPLIPLSVLERVTSALRAQARQDGDAGIDGEEEGEDEEEEMMVVQQQQARRLAALQQPTASLPLPVVTRRDRAGRVTLDAAVETAQRLDQEEKERETQEEEAEAPLLVAPRSLAAVTSSTSASSLPLGASVLPMPASSVPAWSRVVLDQGQAPTSSQLPPMAVPLPAGQTTGGPTCTTDADGAAAYVAVSDEQTCAVYTLGCGTGTGADGSSSPAPVLIYRGPAGCMPCAAFRHVASASIGAAPPAPSPAASPAPGASPAPAASAGPVTPGPDEPASLDNSTDKAGAGSGAGKGGSNTAYPGASAWPFLTDGSAGPGTQALILGAGLVMGAGLGIALYRRLGGRAGRYVRVRGSDTEGQGEEEGEEQDRAGPNAEAVARPSTSVAASAPAVTSGRGARAPRTVTGTGAASARPGAGAAAAGSRTASQTRRNAQAGLQPGEDSPRRAGSGAGGGANDVRARQGSSSGSAEGEEHA